MATALPYDSLITFIETPAFTRMLPDYLDADDLYQGETAKCASTYIESNEGDY